MNVISFEFFELQKGLSERQMMIENFVVIKINLLVIRINLMI